MAGTVLCLRLALAGLAASRGLALQVQSPGHNASGAALLDEFFSGPDMDVDADDAGPIDLGPLRDLFKKSSATAWRESAAGTEKTLDVVLTSAPVRDLQQPPGKPGFCPPAPPIQKGGPPLYIFMMGVEGAGHHAVCPLIRGALHSAGYECGYLSHSKAMHSKNHIHPFGMWRDAFLAELKEWCPTGVCLDCADSFPTGRPLSLGAAPDFVRMMALHKQGAIDMRVVAMERNPVDAVFSAVKRFGPDDPELAFNFAKAFLMHTTKSVAAWNASHCDRLITLQYENLIHQTSDYITAVGDLLGLPPTARAGLAKVHDAYQHAVDKKNRHRNHNYRRYDPELYDIMTSWFNEREAFYWPERRRLWNIR